MYARVVTADQGKVGEQGCKGAADFAHAAAGRDDAAQSIPVLHRGEW